MWWAQPAICRAQPAISDLDFKVRWAKLEIRLGTKAGDIKFVWWAQLAICRAQPAISDLDFNVKLLRA